MVSLILILVVVLGVVIRGTMLRTYLPEGFEDANSGNGSANGNGSGNGNGNGNGGGSGSASGEEKEKEKEGGAVQVDTTSAIRGFLAENGGNAGMMSNITNDTQSMIQNQQELMEMMRNVQPALTQGMEFMKAFKGMMGNN